MIKNFIIFLDELGLTRVKIKLNVERTVNINIYTSFTKDVIGTKIYDIILIVFKQ